MKCVKKTVFFVFLDAFDVLSPIFFKVCLNVHNLRHVENNFNELGYLNKLIIMNDHLVLTANAPRNESE